MNCKLRKSSALSGEIITITLPFKNGVKKIKLLPVTGYYIILVGIVDRAL